MVEKMFQIKKITLFAFVLFASLATGCARFPRIYEEPNIYNPYPQLTNVAVAPFFNQSDDTSLNTVRVARLYGTELQKIPGVEVKYPVDSVVEAMQQTNNKLSSPADFRALAQHLGVDAVVVGYVRDYEMVTYPPKMTLATEWYASNPGYHPILPGYGTPWGTAQEELIPDAIKFEAEHALAREQLKTQTPQMPEQSRRNVELLPPQTLPQPLPQSDESGKPRLLSTGISRGNNCVSSGNNSVRGNNYRSERLAYPVPPRIQYAGNDYGDQKQNAQGYWTVPTPAGPYDQQGNRYIYYAPVTNGGHNTGIPKDWPNPTGFIPKPPQKTRPKTVISNRPVLEHSAHYSGNDRKFTKALADYYELADDARFVGWEAYLRNSEDFIRFCCRMHVCEMFAARGGAGESTTITRFTFSD